MQSCQDVSILACQSWKHQGEYPVSASIVGNLKIYSYFQWHDIHPYGMHPVVYSSPKDYDSGAIYTTTFRK
jgi:hypothetical protein